jgi:antirestriction protein
MISTETKPRIYVACLASYNSGILHGAWFDASTDVDEMQAAINAVIESSPVPDAEEWAFHDYEGLGQLEEYEDLDTIAERLEAYEEYERGPVEAYISNHYEWNESHFQDSFVGVVLDCQWEQDDWLVRQFMECLPLTGDDRDFFEQWADEAKIARTMRLDYTFVSGDDQTAYIFRSC